MIEAICILIGLVGLFIYCALKFLKENPDE